MQYKSISLDDATVDIDQRIIRGYASTWDKDRVDDIIHPGAFRKTISERLPKIKVLRNHKDLIGKPTQASEDGRGLITESYIAKTALGDETLELARAGVLDSLSIGFSIPQGKSERHDGIRHIKEVKLYEWSFVDFPANESAVITGVKALHDLASQTLDNATKLELVEMIDELKALLGGEPVSTTRTPNQPPEVESLLKAIKSFGR